MLQGKKGLIIGIANEHSIAHGCAEAFRREGAELAVTYLNAKAEPYGRPIAEQLGCPIIVPCDVREAGRFQHGNGCFVPFLHPHGADGRASDDRGWLPSYCYFLRLGESRGRVQSNGTGEGRARELCSLHGGRAGPKRIRIHALSPGPLKTRAASGIERFDELLERTRAQTPERQLVGIDDVGNAAAFLASDGAAALTRNIEYIDAGFHILG